jgi:EmrB/QacA subfamily drug resistance transporter
VKASTTPLPAIKSLRKASALPPDPKPSSQPAPPKVAVPFLTIFPSIMLPMFIGIMDQTIVATALPTIAAALGNVDLIAWVVAGYLISTAIAAPVYGRLGDAFGRRRMMVVALTVALAGSALCAASVSIEMLIAARLLQGVGGGGLITLSHALIGQSVPPRDRARYQGYLATISVAASTIGPVVGGLLTQHLGWRSIFLLNIPFLTLGMALVFRLPPRTTPFERFRFDFPGLLLLAVFISSLLIFVQQTQHLQSIDVPLAVFLVVLASLSITLLFLRERRATSPLLPLPLMRNPNIWRSNAIAFFHGALFVSLVSFMPLYLRAVRGASASEIGLFLLPMTVGVGIGSTIIGQIVGRTGRTMIFPTIGVPIVTVLVALLAVVADHMSTIELSWYLGLVSFFLGFVMGVIQVTVQVEAGQLLGTAVASLQLSRSLGAATGTAFVGTVLFAAIVATGTGISSDLQAILQGSADALADLGAAQEATIRANVATAFHSVYLTIAAFGAISAFIAWTMPRRTI